MENSSNHKTNLLFVLNDMEFGGIQKSVLNLLKYLVKEDLYEIDVLLWKTDGPLVKEIPLEVHVLNKEYAPTLYTIKNQTNFYKKINCLRQYVRSKWFSKVLNTPWLFYKRLPKKYDIAISYVHTGIPPFFVIDRVSASKKFLWYHHGSYEKSGADKALDKTYFEMFDNVIAVSESNKLLLFENFKSLQNKLIVVPNITDEEEIIKKCSENKIINSDLSDEYTFVTVSRFSKEKGLDLAIDVALMLKERGIKFKWYFVGDGETLDEIKGIVEKREMSDTCIFTGRDENPYVYMKNANLYIQTSYVEAHPITIIEALVLDKLIVTSDLPSTRELLEDGRLGILCSIEKNEFTNAIINILNDREKQNDILECVRMYKNTNQISYSRINNLFGN